MPSWFPLVFLLVLNIPNLTSCNQDLEAVQAARFGILRAINWAKVLRRLDDESHHASNYDNVAIGDCLKLNEESEPLLAKLEFSSKNYSLDDAITWLIAAIASHRSCLDGLEGKGLAFETHASDKAMLEGK